MPLVLEGSAPDRHDGVSYVLVDHAVSLHDHVTHSRKVLVETSGQLLRSDLLGDLRESGDVGKQDRSFDLDTPQLQLGRVLHDGVDDVFRHITTQHLLDLLSLFFGRPVLIDGIHSDRKQAHQKGLEAKNPVVETDERYPGRGQETEEEKQ